MIALDARENRIDIEPVERWITVIAGACAGESLPRIPPDRAMENLALLYGGAPKRSGPVFARMPRPPERRIG
jgi:hypothetical protein